MTRLQRKHPPRNPALLCAMMACLVALTGFSLPAAAQQSPDAESLRIGIIGTGRIGGTLARHWVNAGHEVLISSRNPDELRPLADELGPRARVGTPREAAAFSDVVLVSVPYAAMPQLGADYAAELAGDIVLDTGNPYPSRDGEMAVAAREKGAGLASQAFLPGTRLVRAFNAISYVNLQNEAHRDGERIGIPIAGDDSAALAMTERLVRDAGFDPVVVGGLADAKRFDPDTPVYVRLLTASELRDALDLPSP